MPIQFEASPFAGPFYQRNCYARQIHNDTIANTGNNSITWYHWNAKNTSFYNDTVRAQGIDPAAATPAALNDPFTHRAFGGKVTGTGLTSVPGSGGLVLATAAPNASGSAHAIDLRVRFHIICNARI